MCGCVCPAVIITNKKERSTAAVVVAKIYLMMSSRSHKSSSNTSNKKRRKRSRGDDDDDSDEDDYEKMLEISSVGDKEEQDEYEEYMTNEEGMNVKEGPVGWDVYNEEEDSDDDDDDDDEDDLAGLGGYRERNPPMYAYDNERIVIQIVDHIRDREYEYSIRPNSKLDKLLEAHAKRVQLRSMNDVRFVDRYNDELELGSGVTINATGLIDGDSIDVLPIKETTTATTTATAAKPSATATTTTTTKTAATSGGTGTPTSVATSGTKRKCN